MNAEAGASRGISSFRVMVILLNGLLIAFVINLVVQPLLEPDLGWHLRAGLDLVAQGWRLPDTDPYSHTMPDWHWVEHAWLTDGLLATIYRGLGAFGGVGLIVFFGAVTGLAWWVASGGAPVPATYRLAAMVGSLWVALPFLGARTQLLSLLGVAFLLRVWQYMQQGHERWFWTLPPLFLCWANLHGGFTAGLFLLTVWLSLSLVLTVCVDRRFLRVALDEPVWSWRDLGRCAMALGLSAAVTLLNPYGWGLYVEIYDSLTDRFMIETLREWQPVSFEGWAGRAYGVYLAGLLCLVAGWYRRVEPVRWVMLLLVLGLSLRHWRNVTLFLIVSLPLMAELLAAVVSSCLRWMPLLKAQATSVLLVLTGATATALYGQGLEHLNHVRQSGRMPERYFEQTEYPIEAVQWIRSHRPELGTRMYNDYGFGGFLLWHLPGERIFIDGRMPAWRIKDRRIFQDYVELNREGAPRLAVLDRYGVDWGLIQRGSGLARVLEGDQAWQTVYADAKVVIVRRRS